MSSLFPVRIVCVDSYMSSPIPDLDALYSEFRGASIVQVPVVRIFGSTSTGQKICVHVHGVFPYIYLPFDGSEEVHGLMYRIAANIDKAINISFNQASSNSQHVYKVSLVSGIPMYGYHKKHHQFLKIYLYNPLLVRKVASLLENDTTLGKLYQPHETHLSFSLQFMIDYNLHGMSNAVFTQVKFRGNPKNAAPELLLPSTIAKTTLCELEGDALAEHIFNRQEISTGKLAVNPGIAAIWEDERQRRRNKHEDSEIGPCLTLSQNNAIPTKSHFIFKQALAERLVIISTDNKPVTDDVANLSVYPAETPENSNIQNASLIVSLTPSSWNSSLDETTLDADDLDSTMINESLNITMDAEAQHLLEILQDLGEENCKEARLEEDSILSQLVKEMDDEEFDMSMPLEAVTTPIKLVVDRQNSTDEEDNTTLIPQLDGNDDEQVTVKRKCVSSNKIDQIQRYSLQNLTCKLVDCLRKRKLPDMPDLTGTESNTTVINNNYYCFKKNVENAAKSNVLTSSSVTKTKCRKIKKIVHTKKKRQLIKKPNPRKINLLNFILKIRTQENRALLLLKDGIKPKFNIVSKRSLQDSSEHGNYKSPFYILHNTSEIPLRDPQIYQIVVVYPTCESFLYHYSRSVYPKVIKIITFENLSQNQYESVYLNSKKYLMANEKSDRFQSIQIKTEQQLKSTVKHLKHQYRNQIIFHDYFWRQIHYQTAYKTREQRRRICSFDGANDSSSSEEDEEKMTVKRRKLCQDSSRYQALPVKIESLGVDAMSSIRGQASKTLHGTLRKISTPLTLTKDPQNMRDSRVKRKLNFSTNTNLQSTFIEENLICQLTPNYQDKNILTCSDPHKIIKQSEIQTNSESEDSDDMFSNTEETDLNGSFFMKQTRLVNAAEKYDAEMNYRAIQGTSRNTKQSFTPSDGSNSTHNSQLNLEKEDKLSGSGSGISSDLITPYQRCVIINNTSASLDEESNSLCAPARKPPTRAELKATLNDFQLESVRNIEPFYSSVSDVTGSVEVGHNVLKIISKSTAHLPEFTSTFDALSTFRKDHLNDLSESNGKITKTNMLNFQLLFCKDRECLLEPVKRPPTISEVKTWIKQKSKAKSCETPKKIVEKVKLFVPLSPGKCDDDDDSLNVSLSCSPCTPQDNEKTSEVPVNQTSPILGKKSRILRSKEGKLLNETSLRKSVLLSQEGYINKSCQLTGISLDNTFGFVKPIENLQDARAIVDHQHLTVLVMELHIRSRGDFKPNPEYDSIRAIFYSISNDVPASHLKPQQTKGIFAINSLPLSPTKHKLPDILDGIGIDCDITYVDSEEKLFEEWIKFMQYWDPDILVGYEIEMLSWGYLIHRASVLGINLQPQLGRTLENNSRFKGDDDDKLKVTGRIVLDGWRLMRHEVALQSYTFESIVYHILQKRVPMYAFKDLSFWWDHRTMLYRYRTVQYYLFRVVYLIELLDKLDFIGRTSELARLFGIQFYEVLSRGSQFRVESMMLRLAKPLNFIPVSPSVQQRAKMRAPEYIPLVLEPESKLYVDPVIVLDFQSLYPSIIIAYNYCFTTCIGRVEHLGKNNVFEFGATQLKISRRRVRRLLESDQLNFSPCGIAFVKQKVRDGILPRMLREILETRLMVKNSMKENKSNSILKKVLHNRQLGLKLIANVTYGYTAANFSGRMPSVEVGDSVVSKGRETLQRAIAMVDSTTEWGARVVYGDTDSLFVLVPGKTREQAFEIGRQIAEAVTNDNPNPVKLKLEKVYQPCILQTKKRYVGYMYEGPEQTSPVFEAKGIETVRRDGCPAASKMLEKSLKLLFDTKDVSLIKSYILRQFNKILAGRVSIQDLTFAKEYRGASGYRPGACVPALELTRKWTAVDKRNEPRSGERVPYVIIHGPPGLPLIRLVRSPRELLLEPSLRPNALYYITRVIIPTINRCFNLIGADLNTWFNEMPRKIKQYLPTSSPGKKSTISQYFVSTSCASCGEQTQSGLCEKCSNRWESTTVCLMEKMRNWERNYTNCELICQSCSGTNDVNCISLDCPVLYRRIQTNRDFQQTSYVRQLLVSNILEF